MAAPIGVERSDTMTDFSITKGTAEVYHIHLKQGFGWGIFYLDETTGTLACVSDYGDYAYRWGNNHGRKSFKDFLAREGNDRHYFLNKLAGKSNIEYKHEETIQNWKRCLLECRSASFWARLGKSRYLGIGEPRRIGWCS